MMCAHPAERIVFMNRPVPGRSVPTRVRLSDNLTKLIVAVFLIPAPFELVTGVIKKEEYDFRRAAIMFGALTILALVLVVLRGWRITIASIVGFYLIVAGVAVAAFGVLLTFRDDVIVARWGPVVETTISTLAPALGLLLVASGAYVLREQHRRVREDLEGPGPVDISNPRTIRIGADTASLWKSETHGSRPGCDAIVELCKKHLSPQDLHFIAYYTATGDCVFYLDFLDDDAMAPFDIVDTPERRRQYEQQGRHIRAVVGRLERRFRGLESGPLVRVVLDVKKGALFFYQLGVEGFLIGVTLDQGQVDPTDRKLSALANEILVRRGGRPNEDFYRN
jgi:hypothetical protein